MMRSRERIELATTRGKLLAAARSALAGTEIDFSGDEIKTKTLTGNTTFTIVNPILGRVLVIELDGVFTVTWPASVTVINGDYVPNVGTNWAEIKCADAATPAYLVSWGVRV